MSVKPRLATHSTQAWAQIEFDRLISLEGDLVAFDGRTAVVALTSQPDIPIGRAVWVVLGVDGEQAARVAASITRVQEDEQGRHCVTLELVDLVGAGQRRHPRVPFHERVEVVGITDRPGPDPRWRAHAFDLSIQGVGAVLPSQIRIGAVALLRFSLPPHRAAFQVRATVKTCERESAEAFRTGFLFERVTAGHVQQLHAAIVHLARSA
ncbi:MAG TPA: PilZ domain-containing protein [Acidimicrobiia bacterium]